MSDSASDLLSTVTRAVPLLLAIDADASAARPAPGKWSKREILGHLIDSASNNHQRFVRAVFQGDLVFAGYEQDDWVAVQDYQHASWPDLVSLWAAYNRHLAWVMSRIPESVRTRRHTRHNLHQLAYAPVAVGEPTTLEFFMADYVAHLRHHLGQILGPDALAG